MSNFGQLLRQHTKEGELYEGVSGDRMVICHACAHRCRIGDGKSGICKVRYNHAGKLMVPSGYVSSLHDDPIEKKPFYHVYPGIKVMSFGMFGCDFHCDFCQNWNISHLLEGCEREIRLITPEEICGIAEARQSKGFASTYNEPLITSEWSVEIFKKAKSRGFLTCCYVSNGHGTPEAIEYIRPWVDCCKIDLKSFDRKTYRKLGGKLDAVLNTIDMVYRKGLWLEIVTLIIPGLNDSDDELKQMAELIASVSVDIPWHITAFHPNFKMIDRAETSPSMLLKAYEIGKNAGINFIYPGNLPGQTGELEHTYCKECGTLLVERYGFHVMANHIKAGHCYKCNDMVPGRWAM